MTKQCNVKHTKYQVEDCDWACPRCGEKSDGEKGFIIYASPPEAEDADCELLHDEDFLMCFNCQYETSGKRFSSAVAKKKNLIPCPTCKGKGMVEKK